MLAYEYSSPDEIPDWFWEIIGRSEESYDKLRELLLEISTDEIFRFEAAYGGAVCLLLDERFHGGSEGESEDAIGDISKWAVGQGKDYYFDVWNLKVQLPGNEPESGSLYSAILEVYDDRLGEAFYSRSLEGAVKIII